MLPVSSYSILFNLLHFPAGVVPVTRVQEDEQAYREPLVDSYMQLANESLKGAKGMPVDVQIAGLPFQDELCLSVMKDIESCLPFDRPFLK